MEDVIMRERVGASIVEIITESLYDKPIVVFREYVQNSADSLAVAELDGSTADLSVHIWKSQNNLFFWTTELELSKRTLYTKCLVLPILQKSEAKISGTRG